MKDKIFEYCKKAYIDTFNSEFEEYRKSHGGAKKILEEAERIAQKQAIKEALLPSDLNFIVTPKEIDELIENTRYISSGNPVCLVMKKLLQK